MQIVIEITDRMYEAIKQDHVPIDIGRFIRNGTPLPKGHGRLIDADAINIHNVSPAYGMEVYGVTQDDIEYESTIIEADKAESEDK